MTFTSHPSFSEPRNAEAVIWRYMDLPKFMHLISTRSLFFTRLDRFDDPYEGSWPRANVQARPRMFQDVADDVVRAQAIEAMARATLQFRACCAANCWHMNEHESTAMWRLYNLSGDGIAVRSTINRLKAGLICNEEVYVGAVQYIDYENHWISPDNLFNATMHKRASFSHEREVRAMVVSMKDFEKGIPSGLSLSVDLNELIDSIYVSPTSADWFLPLLTDIVEKYEVKKDVVKSRLMTGALF